MNFYKKGNLIKRISVIKCNEIRTLRWPTAQITKTQECRAKFGKLNFKVTEQTKNPQCPQLGYGKQYKRYYKIFPSNLLSYMFVIPN